MEKAKVKELAVYITEQLAELDNIRKTPMMGGYIFYYRERIFGGILIGIYGKDTRVKPDICPTAFPARHMTGQRKCCPLR